MGGIIWGDHARPPVVAHLAVAGRYCGGSRVKPTMNGGKAAATTHGLH